MMIMMNYRLLVFGAHDNSGTILSYPPPPESKKRAANSQPDRVVSQKELISFAYN
jgi:hypothetical protein